VNLPIKRKPGRPPGTKNKDTLFKELMSGRFQEKAESDIQRVYEVLFTKAHKGDMKAIKLILDRVVPTTRAVDMDQMEKGGLQINISVGHMEDQVNVEAIEAEFEEV
jgi:hypothetical protein